MPNKGEYIYFAGCYTSYLLPEIKKANEEILKAAGVDLVILEDEQCCGESVRQSGNIKSFKKVARKNVEAIKEVGAKYVIVSCAHCYNILKIDYPDALGEELPFEVVHVTDLIANLIKEGKIKLNHQIHKKVTFHDPCFLKEEGMDYMAPREILKAIPGIEMQEMKRWGRGSHCCGAGGKIPLNCCPDFAAAIGTERINEAKEAADNVVTACPICYNQLRHTAKSKDVDIDVCDISVLVAEAMA